MAKTATAKQPTVTDEDKKHADEAKAKRIAAVATVKSSALSVDVGPRVIAGLDKASKDEAKANELLNEVKSKRYDLLSETTLAIVKAAKHDDTINLGAAFSGDTKAMSLLNDQLGLALGFRERVEIDGNPKIVTAKAVSKFFPGPKEDKKSPAYAAKNTLRTNFLHLLKKCAQAASAIVEKDIAVKMDATSGTLSISGPAVKKAFGEESVLLNEKVTIGEGDNVKTLAQKPSFTALAKIGAEAEGKTLQTRADSRANKVAEHPTAATVDPQVAMQSLCDTVIKAITKLGKPEGQTIKSLESLRSAIDKILGK